MRAAVWAVLALSCSFAKDTPAPGPGATCERSPIVATHTLDPESVQPCGTPRCWLEGGVPTLSFCCSPGNWTQCRFESGDFDRFDADHGNQGMIEISFCLTERIADAHLTFYYGRHPYRKGLPLLSEADRTLGLGPGCYARYYMPADAQCAAYDPQALPTADFPPACARPSEDPTWPCPAGKWSSLEPACGAAPFDYDGVPFWITAEFCSATASAAVKVQSVRWLSETCKCGGSRDCAVAGGVRCAEAHATAPFCAQPELRCAGVCTDLSLPPAP